MYSATGTPETDLQAADYFPLVKRIAHHLIVKLPASVEIDDLIQVGTLGLLEAIGNFNGNHGAQFETYAAQRIRGAMLDELRQLDWLPRSARKAMRDIEAAIHRLEHRLGRQPSEQEIAETMSMPLENYQQMLQEARGHQLLHYEDFYGSAEASDDFFDRHLADNQSNPLEKIQDAGFRRQLVDAIQLLPEREKLMMGLYYEEELNLREIGEVLGVSESRVCQLHSQAIARLRSQLKDWV
ncbi:MAG: RNA polymerase sigma factor FliA [Burkholderiales bacterium]